MIFRGILGQHTYGQIVLNCASLSHISLYVCVCVCVPAMKVVAACYGQMVISSFIFGQVLSQCQHNQPTTPASPSLLELQPPKSALSCSLSLSHCYTVIRTPSEVLSCPAAAYLHRRQSVSLCQRSRPQRKSFARRLFEFSLSSRKVFWIHPNNYSNNNSKRNETKAKQAPVFTLISQELFWGPQHKKITLSFGWLH